VNVAQQDCVTDRAVPAAQLAAPHQARWGTFKVQTKHPLQP